MPDMTFDVALVAGQGLVARRGDRVAVLRPTATTEQVERVLAVFDRPAVGRRFVEAVGAAAVASGCRDVAALATDDTERVVLVRGGFAALVGERVVDGRDADGWHEEAVPDGVQRVLVAPPGDRPRVTRASTLLEGVVPAVGVEVVLVAVEGSSASVPATPPARQAAAEAPAPASSTDRTGSPDAPGAPPRGAPNAGDAFVTGATPADARRAGDGRAPDAFVDLTRPDAAALDGRAPLAVVTSEQPAVAGGEPEEQDDDVVLVDGVSCVRGHFNRPDVLYCSVCGISMVHATLVLKPGPRPPLGVLVADDGASWRLDGDYLVGRRPPAAEVGADLRPLVLSDPEQSVSRAHAEVRLSGWDVLVVDRGSSNGTFVAAPGEAWQRLSPGQSRMLEPGEWVLFGRRVLVYEGHHVRGDQPEAV